MFRVIILGSVEFFIGLLLGILVDAVYFTVYRKIDPQEKSKTALISLLVCQVILVVTLFTVSEKYIDKLGIHNIYFRIGFLSGQTFLFNRIVSRLSMSSSRRR